MAKNVPTNKALYARVKAEAKRKYKVWPSAYASGWLTKWFGRNKATGWVDCKTGKPCGRKSAKKGKSKRPYPACRPTKAQCKKSVAKRKTGPKRVSWKKGKK